MHRFTLIVRLLIAMGHTTGYILLPISHTYRLTQDIDTTQFSSLKDVQNQRGEEIFLMKGSNLLLNPLIRDDLYDLGQALKNHIGPQSVRIFSIYRSIATQASLKSHRHGTSAYFFTSYPGASEHHLGTTIDLEFVREHRAGMQWLKANAYRYGFIQSFPKHCQSITGIPQEDRHRRRIGRELASLFWTVSSGNTQLCLQTFLEHLEEFDIILPEKIGTYHHHNVEELAQFEQKEPHTVTIPYTMTSFMTQTQYEQQPGLIRLGPLLLPPQSKLIRRKHGWFLIEDRGLYRAILGRLTPFRRDPSPYHMPSTALLFADIPQKFTHRVPRQAQSSKLPLW